MPSTTAAAASNYRRPHILVFPFPAQGHMLPLLDLTHQLALRNLLITILVTPKNLPILTPLLSTHPTTVQILVLPFPPHPNLPAGIENVKDIGMFGISPIVNALSDLQDPIIQWFESHHSPPVALISDFFLGWTEQLARRINIARIAFFSSGAFLASVLDYGLTHLSEISSSSSLKLHDLPRSPSLKIEHLPPLLRFYRGKFTPLMEFFKDSLLENVSSWGSVFNTFEALEDEYLRYLKKRAGHERVYSVGPLSLIGNEERESDYSDRDIMAWLDGCPEDSVLYVCFGSQKLLSEEQMEALAIGLERSGVRFLWVVKAGTAEQAGEGKGVVPKGFEEKVGGRGLVIRGWAPQVSILNHKAVGGFLSHCGWNSLLEAAASGVRILAWPMEVDQHVNARLLVEDMGVAVRVCEGDDGVPDPIELCNLVAKAMGGDAPEDARVKKLRDAARAVVKDGGSSANNLDELVRELCKLPNPVGKKE